MSRLLFIELMAVDRFHRAIEFAFLRGAALERGVASRWLRFGLPAEARAADSEPGFALDAADSEQLCSRAQAFAPTHVIWSQPPTAAQARSLDAAFCGACVAVLEQAGGAQPLPAGYRALAGRLADFVAFLGDEAPVDVASTLFAGTPDFGFEACNEAAAHAPSLPFIILGDECAYAQPFAHSPQLAALDLSGCVRSGGCSFCTRGPGQDGARVGVSAAVLARRQLTALARTHPPVQGRLSVRAVGAHALKSADELCALVCELPLPPTDVLLDARADTLVAARSRLTRGLVHLVGSPHRLHVALVGIESFVDAELALFNKGTTWRDNLAAATLLFELEAEQPKHFAFREHGGLSLLLLTPWTELSNLALNLATVAQADLAGVCGKLFTSRLRLYPSIPLHALARHDGLLTDRYDDPLLDTARRNFYPDEVPWRFADPRLEPVCRLLLRLEGARDGDGDALTLALRGARETPARRLGPLPLAQALVDEALASAAPLAVEELLGRVVTPQRPARGRSPDGDMAPLAAGGGVDHLLAAVLGGCKPVARLENVAPEVLARAKDDPRWRRLHWHSRPYDARSGGGGDCFVGVAGDAVELASALTSRLEHVTSDAQWRDLARQMGALLGYPACCTEAFVTLPPRWRESYVYVHIAQRLAFEGEAPRLLSPMRGDVLEYVPCSLGCAAALARATALAELVVGASGGAARRALDNELAHPWLLIADPAQPGVAGRAEGMLELCTDAVGDDGFRYHAGAGTRSHPLLARVTLGDELRFDEQQLVVLKDGAPIASLGARAFVWWYARPLQREFWRGLLATRFASGRKDSRREDLAGGDSTTTQQGDAADALLGRLGRVLLGRTVAGCRITQARLTHRERLELVLSGREGDLRLYVAQRSAAPHGYLSAGRFTVMLAKGERAMSAPHDRAVRRLGDFLAERSAALDASGEKGA